MNLDFTNKTVLVTGGSRGIGRSIALMFAEAGAQVVVHYRGNQAAAEQTLAALAGEGHFIAQGDLANAEAVKQLAETVIAQAGQIDVLVNNAGIYELHDVSKVSFEEWQQAWQQTINTNLIGVANLSYFVVQQMIKQGSGRIVNVSSRGAFRGEPMAPAYGASKAGMNAMGQSMAQALAPHNIFVHTVAPGFVETDMAAGILAGPLGDGIRKQSPLGRVAKPEEVARTVLFLAAEGTEFLTGCIVDVNGASYLRS